MESDNWWGLIKVIKWKEKWVDRTYLAKNEWKVMMHCFHRRTRFFLFFVFYCFLWWSRPPMTSFYGCFLFLFWSSVVVYHLFAFDGHASNVNMRDTLFSHIFFVCLFKTVANRSRSQIKIIEYHLAHATHKEWTRENDWNYSAISKSKMKWTTMMTESVVKIIKKKFEAWSEREIKCSGAFVAHIHFLFCVVLFNLKCSVNQRSDFPSFMAAAHCWNDLTLIWTILVLNKQFNTILVNSFLIFCACLCQWEYRNWRLHF